MAAGLLRIVLKSELNHLAIKEFLWRCEELVILLMLPVDSGASVQFPDSDDGI